MGLLTIPKKYNPPGNDKRDMEYPIFATKQEMGLLKIRGGAGKMTKHGIRSYGLGDKGNSVGSAGGSNYSGDGMGGQVNMGGVGMGGPNVLRQIDGRWTSVSRAAASQIDAGGGLSPIRQKPAVPAYQPVAQPVVTPPVVKPEVYLDPQIAGRLQSALASKAASVSSTMAAKSAREDALAGATNAVSPASSQSYPNSMPGNSNPSLNYGAGTTNSTSTLGMASGKFGAGSSQTGGMSSGGLSRYSDASLGGKFGAGSSQAGAMPSAGAITDPYGGMGKFGMNSGQTSPYNQPSAAVTDPWGGMGKMGMNSGQTSPYNQPASNVAMDPQIAGRLQDTRRPGYGVPEVPNNVQTVAKTPGPRVSLPVTAGLGSINEMLNGLQSGWAQPNIADPRLNYPSEEGQVYGPASLASYPGVTPKIQDRVATRSTLTPGQTLNNQTINDAVHPNSMLNASRMPQGNPVSPASFGPETPQGPADWQQGTGYTDPVKSNAPMRTQDIQIDPTSSFSPAVQTTASRIMDAIDKISTSPGSFGPGGGDRRGGGHGSNGGGNSPAPAPGTTPPPVTPPVTPPATPTTPAATQLPWYYPQYTQSWLNLPQGLGGYMDVPPPSTFTPPTTTPGTTLPPHQGGTRQPPRGFSGRGTRK